MHLLFLDYGFTRFRDWERQHDLALLNTLPRRLLAGCPREVPHQHVPLHLVHPFTYALQGHNVVTGTIFAPDLESTRPSGAWDGDSKGAELAQEEEKRRAKVAELGAQVCAVFGRREA